MTTKTPVKPAAKAPAQFTVPAAEFGQAVAAIAKISGSIAGRAPVARLQFRDQRVTISGTDYDTAVSIKLPVKGKRGADIGVDSRKLAAFVKGFKAGDVSLAVSDSELVVGYGGMSEFTLRLEQDSLPMAPEIGDDVVTEPFPTDRFVAAVGAVSVAASRDEARPVLTGIFFDGENAVATDSYRLARLRDVPMKPMLVPAVAARVAATMFDGQDATIAQGVDRIVLRSKTSTFSTRLIAGDFPNWKPLVRDTSTAYMTVDRKALLAALALVAPANEGSTPVRLSVAKGVLTLTVSATDGPTATAELAVDGSIPNVALNGDFLAAELKTIPNGTVRFGAVDAGKVVQIDNGTDESPWTIVQMPVRVPG